MGIYYLRREKKMETLLLVDGMNLLFQMFYGMPARILGRNGKPIQGVLGFLGAVLKMIRMVEPAYAAVLFDGEYTTERTNLDGAYKGNRVDYSKLQEEETPFSQLQDICRGLDLLGIAYAQTTSCEADDWIAGYARQYGKDNHVVIASQDSDFFQLISDNVQVLRYRGKQSVICGPGYIKEKLGILPAQYAGFKALTGDTADNIRGVDKVGPKTAALLMNQFDSLESLLENIEMIERPAIRSTIRENTGRIRKNYDLILLEGAKELPFSLQNLRFYDRGLSTMQVLSQIGLR